MAQTHLRTGAETGIILFSKPIIGSASNTGIAVMDYLDIK